MPSNEIPSSTSPRSSCGRAREGKASGSTIRLLVLLLLLIGVGVFGYVRRPDLAREYLNLEAPAWDTRQALTFANEELFKVASALAIAEVSLLDTDRDTAMAMAETGGFVEGLTQQELLDDPAKAAAVLAGQIGQIERDATRAADKLSPNNFKSAGDQSLTWKTLSLAEQVGRSLETLAPTPLGEALDESGAPKSVANTITALESIQSSTSPARKNSTAEPRNPNSM